MKTKEEIVKKINETQTMLDVDEYSIYEYLEGVICALKWSVGDRDDPLEDYYLDGF